MGTLKFKYRDATERSLNILRDRKLYFPKAEQLNDPLDSQIDIDAEYRKVVERFPPSKSEEYLRKAFLIHMLNQHKFPDRNGKDMGLNGALKWFMSTLGICSLSSTATDALLWSHYGGSHKGMCLEFDTDILVDDVFKKGIIKYKQRPPYQDLFISLADRLGEFARPWEEDCSYEAEVGSNFYTLQLTELMDANLMVKSEKWKYEEEYRVITTKPGNRSFPAKALKTVIFGFKSDINFISQVENELKDPDYAHVEIKYVQHVPGSFEFEVVKFCNTLMDIDRIT